MTYQSNIPLSTDLISVSQGDIKNNFMAIGSAWPVNHVNFNSAGAGKHNFVEFPNQASDPVTGANETTLYAKIVSGVSRLFLREEGSGSVLQFTGPVTASTNGGSMILGGIVIKWGSVNAPALNPQPFSYAGGAFPTAVFQVIVSGDRPNDGQTRALYVQTGTAASLTGFSATYTGTYDVIRYIAIGH